MKRNLYWFCFCFSSPTSRASTYVGFEEHKITLNEIRKAKEDAGMPDGSVLECVSFLGFMTREEFTGE